MTSSSYGFHKTVPGTIASVRPSVEAALKAQGFGVLTEIDLGATLEKKLGVDFRPYVILGACNPKFAHEALQGDDDIGLLLPCNVVLQEREPGQVRVSVIDPKAMFSVIDTDDIGCIADQVEARLRDALDAVGG